MKLSIALTSLVFVGTAFANNPLSLCMTTPPIEKLPISSVQQVQYVLTNNSNSPVKFQLTATPASFAIDYKYSNCQRGILNAAESCQIQLHLQLPAQPSVLKTTLMISSKNGNEITRSFTYQATKTTKPTKNLNPQIKWEPVTSLTGGNITSIAYSTANKDLLYATTLMGPIYTSSDKGAHWNLLSNNSNVLGTVQLLWDSNTVYALNDSFKVFKSTDAGQTWSDFNQGLNIESGSTAMNRLVEGNHVLYTIGDHNIHDTMFMRSDKDTRWILLNSPQNLEAGSLLYTNDTLYVGNYNPTNQKSSDPSIYELDQGHSTWKALNLNGLCVNSLFSDGNALYASNCIPDRVDNVWTNSIYKSVDKGKTWNNVSNQVGYSVINQFTKLGNTLYAAGSIGGWPTPSGGGVFKTTDGGDNWQPINNGVPYLNDNNITTVGNDLFLSTVGGAYKSIDGGNHWVSINNGILAKQINSISVLPTGEIFLGDTAGDLSKSLNNGISWDNKNKGLDVNNTASPFKKQVIQLNDGTLLLSGDGGVYKSIDGGSSWINISNIIKGSLMDTLINSPMASSKNKIFVAGSENVYVSSDKGKTWVPIPTGDGELNFILHIVISHNELYAATYQNIYKIALDGKSDWQYINNNLPSPGRNGLVIFAIAKVKDGNNDKIFLATNAGVYYSKDGGQNWIAANTGLPKGVIVTSLIAKGTHLIIGTANNELFYSTDAGMQWLNAGMVSTPGPISALGANKDYIFAAGITGLFKMSAQELGF